MEPCEQVVGTDVLRDERRQVEKTPGRSVGGGQAQVVQELTAVVRVLVADHAGVDDWSCQDRVNPELLEQCLAIELAQSSDQMRRGSVLEADAAEEVQLLRRNLGPVSA